MLQKLSLIDLVKGVKTKLETNTTTLCYDEPPKDAQAPLYYIEVVNKRQADTKTMFCEVYTIWLHIIGEDKQGNVQMYNLIQEAEEALTEGIDLPEAFELVLQTSQGIIVNKTDESGEKHVVIAYDFKISYGFKMKV